MPQRFINKRKTIVCSDSTALAESLEFIEATLGELGIQRKMVLHTILLAEEVLPQFLQNAKPGKKMRIQVRRFLGDAVVTFRARGRQFDLLDGIGEDAEDGFEEMGDEEAQRAARSILLKAQGEKLRLTHRGGINSVRILVGLTGQSMLFWTVGALIAGLLFGLLMQFALPEPLSSGIDTYLLTPFKTMFMNALKIIIAPVVFFSIASCIAQFKDIAELGKIAAKVMGVYMVTTLLAVLLSMGLFFAIQPGSFGFALSLRGAAKAVSVDTNVDTSLLSTIVNIVPGNFLRPFLESDTLQLIFLGVLCGVAVGMLGKYTPILQDFFDACNSLFVTITSLISRLIPIAVFCSTALSTKDLGGSSMLSVLGFAGTTLLAIACMLAIYGLMVLVLGRLNPATFFRKCRVGMLTSFTLSSSSAAMPTNMNICTEKLGISPRVCSFSIPLGATVNMDGTSIVLTVGGLFLARACGIEVPTSALAAMAVTIIMLSLGCPGVPGVGIVCLGIVLRDLSVPIESIGLVMGIMSILDMFVTMSNTTGDMSATLVVAKSEGLVDLKVYNSK